MHYIELVPTGWSLSHEPGATPQTTSSCAVLAAVKAADPPLRADEPTVHECWADAGVFVLGPEVGYQSRSARGRTS